MQTSFLVPAQLKMLALTRHDQCVNVRKEWVMKEKKIDSLSREFDNSTRVWSVRKCFKRIQWKKGKREWDLRRINNYVRDT